MSSLPQLPPIATCTACNRFFRAEDLRLFSSISAAFDADSAAALRDFGVPRTVPRGARGDPAERYAAGTGKAFALDCIGMTKMCCRNALLSYFP